MLNIVLVEPLIPQNTGNIARTCAATGARLHLIEPLGFDISEKAVKRAGLDYWHLVDLHVWPDLPALFEACHPDNLWLATAKAAQSYTDPAVSFKGDCWLAGGVSSGIRPSVHSYSHPFRGTVPQPFQFCGHPRIRGPASKRLSRFERPGDHGPDTVNFEGG